LQTFLRGRTTIIIAHRLSAVQQADRVFVFDNGKIVEHGRHQDLLEASGLYARLYGQRQAVNS
jgi:ATP-binding cassette subfamily C protein